MHVAGPGLAPGPGGAPLRLRRVLAREFPGHSAASLDPDLRVFVTDLVRPYGLALDEDALRAGRGHAYAELAEPLVRELVTADRPVDLLVLVFASPDVQPGRAAAVYLSGLCPGRPLAFALCDQGAAGAFTALRIAREYLRSGDCRRALVLVAEQAQAHYAPAGPGPWPDRHAAVALLCEWDGESELASVRDLPGVSPGRLPQLLAEEISALASELAQTDTAAPVLLLGPGLAGVAPPPVGEVVRARTGSPYTGLWSALADGLPRWQAKGRPVLLAEYEARLGYLSLVGWTSSGARPHEQEVARPFVQERAG